MEKEIIFKMQNISKHFPGVQALSKVTFDLRKGEVHALVGENGAGKSTLIKILSGIYHPDSGQIIYKGNPIIINNPKHAIELGISTIYQELNLCQNLTVAENIFLGNEYTKTFLGYLQDNEIIKKSKKYLDLLGEEINPKAIVSTLTVAQQQVVEIAKALAAESEIIIMDEPTASLTLLETRNLFQIIRKLKEQGRSIIYISHRLKEVFDISDRVTVLRDGKLTGSKFTKDLSYNEIVKMMVGRAIENKYVATKTRNLSKVSKKLLEVKDLTRKPVFKNINFTLHAGEILGFSGLVGSGRTELARAIFGLDKYEKGKILIEGQEKKIVETKDAINNGIGLVPEDRKRGGVFLNFSIRENISISYLDRLSICGYILEKNEKKLVSKYIKQLDIKPGNSEVKVLNMSGGNQQKVAIAKWLATNPKILIMDEPTRGIDIGAKSEIYHLIRDLAKQGKGIIIISSELPEILSLSDRILVMNKGEIVGEFANKDATEEKIMELAV